jgi:hypothetical protein
VSACPHCVYAHVAVCAVIYTHAITVYTQFRPLVDEFEKRLTDDFERATGRKVTLASAGKFERARARGGGGVVLLTVRTTAATAKRHAAATPVKGRGKKVCVCVRACVVTSVHSEV